MRVSECVYVFSGAHRVLVLAAVVVLHGLLVEPHQSGEGVDGPGVFLECLHHLGLHGFLMGTEHSRRPLHP